MAQNCLINPMFGGFWMVLLTWDARNTICLAFIGYFSQNMVFNSWSLLFLRYFLNIFSIFRNCSSKHFWKYLKICLFSGKSYESIFCSKFTQLSGKLSMIMIGCVLPELQSKPWRMFAATSQPPWPLRSKKFAGAIINFLIPFKYISAKNW